MSYVWQATITSGLESHNSCHLPLFQHYTLLLNSIPSVLQLSDTQIRKSHTATNEQQHSNSEGPYSENNTFLKFVHMEQDRFQNKCPCSICTKISSSSACPSSPRATLVILNKFRQSQLALMLCRNLQRITSLSTLFEGT